VAEFFWVSIYPDWVFMLKMRRTMVLYNILFITAVVWGFPLIIPIVLTSEKRRKTVLQRLGLTGEAVGTARNRGDDREEKPIWVHALSVGEVLSSVPLVEELINRFTDRKVFVSVSTKTGFEIAKKTFGKIADGVFYYPYDLVFSVKRSVGKVDPALVVIVESDIWPNFLFEMKKRHVPVVLANARLSQRSYKGYKRFAVLSKPLFGAFEAICTQSVEDAARFRALGVPSHKVTVTGNIKFEQRYRPITASEINNLKQSLHIQPLQKVLLAGSTHKGEEEILLDAFIGLKQEFDDLLLIIAPRDPQRARSVQRQFQSADFFTALMQELAHSEPDRRLDVIVIDTIGVLKRMYALADAAFVGGSLVNCGGHNPLEPAEFSKPILFGPYMSDFDEISRLLVSGGSAIRVHDAKGLGAAAFEIFTEHKHAEEMGTKAFKVFNDHKGAVEKTLKVVETCFENRA
jgi:3-deoxy-D-manno-octulosonic-acid transferase